MLTMQFYTAYVMQHVFLISCNDSENPARREVGVQLQRILVLIQTLSLIRFSLSQRPSFKLACNNR
jgi:hypothetical protein